MNHSLLMEEPIEPIEPIEPNPILSSDKGSKEEVTSSVVDSSQSAIHDFPIVSASSTTQRQNEQQQLLLGLSTKGSGLGNGPGALTSETHRSSANQQSKSSLNPKDIAQWLISRDYLLTALEFYTELSEDGQEIRELREYFANHKNFDVGRYCPPASSSDRQLAPSRHIRSHSDTYETETMSSFEDVHSPHIGQHMTVHSRISASEQGDQIREKDEYIAVLEYELRQAKDAAEKLKTRLNNIITNKDNEFHPVENQLGLADLDRSLTAPKSPKLQPQISDASFSNQKKLSLYPSIIASKVSTIIQSSSLPTATTQQETRILNYLVHEYLQSQGFKMTALTFSDENEDQDLDDWEDVLGVSKDVVPPPPSMSMIYKQWKTGGPQVLNTSINSNAANNSVVSASFISGLNPAPAEPLTANGTSNDQRSHAFTSNQSLQISSICHTDAQMTDCCTDVKTPELDHLPHTVSVSRLGSCNEVQSEITHDQRSTINAPRLSLNAKENTGTHVRTSSGAFRAKAVAIRNSSNTPTTPNVQEMPVHKLIKTLQLSNVKSDKSKIDLIKDAQQNSLILTLGQALPKIIPSLLLNRREDLIPLLLASIKMHPDQDVRASLTSQLFHLIKKPDGRQRQLISDGILQLLVSMPPDQIHVDEIIAECFELSTSKFQEKRLLALELCGQLSSYFNDRTGLEVLSILCRLQSDFIPLVRLSVYKTLALQLNYIDFTLNLQENGKLKDEITQNQELSQMINVDSRPLSVYQLVRFLVICGLKDSNIEIARVVRDLLVPVFLDVLRNSKPCADNLQTFVDGTLDHIIRLIESKTTLTQSALDPMNLITANLSLEITVHLQLLQNSFHHIFLDILFSSPFYDDQLSNYKETETDDSLAFENPELVKLLWSQVSGWMHSFFSEEKTQETQENVEIPKIWPEVEWVVYRVVPRLGQLMRTVDPVNVNVMTELGKTIRSLCILFGKQFTSFVFYPIFVTLSEENLPDTKDVAHRLRLIPYSLYSVIPSLENSTHNLQLFIQAVYVYMCSERYQWLPQPDLTVLRTSLQMLLADFSKKYADTVMNIFLDFANHEDHRVRLHVSSFLSVICDYISSSVVHKRVVPTLIALSNDEYKMVRLSTVHCFGALLEKFSQNNELSDKIQLQLSAFIEDPQPQIKMSLFSVYASMLPNMDEKIRDGFVFPSLMRWATVDLRGKQPSSMNDAQQRIELIASASQVYQAATSLLLSDAVINQYIVSSLQMIKKELQLIYQSITADGSAPATDVIEAARALVDQLIIKFSPFPAASTFDIQSKSRTKDRPPSAPLAQKQKDIKPEASIDNPNPVVPVMVSTSVPTSGSKFSITKFFQKFHDRSSSQSSNITVVAPAQISIASSQVHEEPSARSEIKDDAYLSPNEALDANIAAGSHATASPISLKTRDESDEPLDGHQKLDSLPPQVVSPTTPNFQVEAPLPPIKEQNSEPDNVVITAEDDISPVPEFGYDRGSERCASTATLSFDIKSALKKVTASKDEHLAISTAEMEIPKLLEQNQDNAVQVKNEPSNVPQKSSPISNPILESKNFFDFDGEETVTTSNILSPILQSIQDAKTETDSIDFIIDTVYPPKEEVGAVNEGEQKQNTGNTDDPVG